MFILNKGLGAITPAQYQDYYDEVGMTYQEAVLNVGEVAAEKAYINAKASWLGTLSDIFKIGVQTYKATLPVKTTNVNLQGATGSSFLNTYGLYLLLGGAGLVGYMLLKRRK